LVLAPVYGPPINVRDTPVLSYATMDDFNKFVKLGYYVKWLPFWRHQFANHGCAVKSASRLYVAAHMTLSENRSWGR